MLTFQDLSAIHIVGGEIFYTYIGAGTGNSSRYRVTLRLFTECGQSCGNGSSVACPPSSVVVGIFNNEPPYDRVQNITISQTANPSISLSTYPPCLNTRPPVCYRVNTYSAEVTLTNTPAGYRLAYQTCCRAGTLNVQSNAATLSGVPGATYETVLPGTRVLPVGRNSNAVVNLKDTSLVCYGSPFRLEFTAQDPDGDSLSYSFGSAFNGGSFTATNDAQGPDNPLYGYALYNVGFSGASPLGPRAQIDNSSGVITGIAPNTPGKYVVNVIIREWRNGIQIAEHQKDFIMKVENCVIPQAQLNPDNRTCDGFTRDFFNAGSNTGVNSWFWDFGVRRVDSDTSISPNPTFTYPDTGVYTLTLIVNKGSACVDTATTVVKVYPGFFPGFNVNPPYCTGVPVGFTDQTRTNYGTVNKWRWDFGVSGTAADTSNLRNPQFVYTAPGTYTIKLVVSNSFGCTDSTTRQVEIKDSPALGLFPRDTSYCALDSVTLTATGTGIFSWTPSVNILNAGTATPTVFPTAPTRYFVSLNANGCVSGDSILVNPRNDLSATITASAATVCAEDTVILRASANYRDFVSWSWLLPAPVHDPDSSVTTASPTGNTRYRVQARWGRNCTATAEKDITVRPLAVPEAGPNTSICLGQGQAQLQASGGDRYQWVPATGLSNPNIPNPMATPSVTTVYTVRIGVNGCSKIREDSVQVLVRALPQAGLPEDTLICSIDTLQLKANNAYRYTWSPDYMISSLTAAQPLVSPDVPTTYRATITDVFGCVNTDSIFVDVKLFVTIDAGNDTTLCRTDTFHLRTVSDALSYQWSPARFLSSSTVKSPVATPLDSLITYTVIGNIGKCQSRDSVTLRTVPYPQVTINPDTSICYGDNAALRASGGSSYSWTPVTFLNAPASNQPISVKPTADTRYTVSVRDNKGCPKPVTASTLVKVRPPVRASVGVADTSIVVGQSVQFNASGGDQYVWTPSRWLSDINNPRATAAPESDITYTLKVTQVPENCTGFDSVRIKVFLLPPSFYVPTAFSPNGDGLNEVLRPIALGMKSIRYFRIYNRNGQLIFSTTEKGKGWDGTYKGNPQDPGNYVWMAQGETWQGELITRKGNAVLIR